MQSIFITSTINDSGRAFPKEKENETKMVKEFYYCLQLENDQTIRTPIYKPGPTINEMKEILQETRKSSIGKPISSTCSQLILQFMKCLFLQVRNLLKE